MSDHAVEIDLGLKLLGPAAQHQHVGHARDDPEPALHHPVLQRLELHDVDFRRPLELIPEDFTDAAGRRDHGLHAGRKHGVLEPVDHLLPYEIVVAAILELNPDEAQRVHGVGADEPQSRRAGDGDFERDGDVALHLLRRLAGILGDDFDDGRSGIRIGLDVESGECRIAHRQEGGEADQYQRPARETERDQAGKHASTGLAPPHHACGPTARAARRRLRDPWLIAAIHCRRRSRRDPPPARRP